MRVRKNGAQAFDRQDTHHAGRIKHMIEKRRDRVMRRMYRKNRMEENFTQQLEPGYSRRPRKYAYSRGDCRSSRRRINRGGQIHRYGDTIDMRGFRTHHFGHYPRGQKAFRERAIAPIYREKRQLEHRIFRLQQRLRQVNRELAGRVDRRHDRGGIRYRKPLNREKFYSC
jgi:hypothetical protein